MTNYDIIKKAVKKAKAEKPESWKNNSELAWLRYIVVSATDKEVLALATVEDELYGKEVIAKLVANA